MNTFAKWGLVVLISGAGGYLLSAILPVPMPQPAQYQVIRTDTIMIVDTITIIKPQYNVQTFFEKITDTLYIDRIINDSMAVARIPLSQYNYSLPGVYDLDLTGYAVTLDSLRIFQKNTEIFNQLEKVSLPTRLAINLAGGAGLGINSLPSPYIEVQAISPGIGGAIGYEFDKLNSHSFFIKLYLTKNILKF